MSTKLRLRQLDPSNVALAAYEQAATDAARRAKALSSQLSGAANAERSPVYRTVLRLARYAIEGEYESDDWTVASDVEPLAGVFAEMATVPREPDTALALVIMGAYARERLDTAKPVSSPELAVLAGLDRDHINRLAAEGTIPGAFRSEKSGTRPWMFRPSAALRAWLQSYNTPASQDPTHGNASP
jgi:hypothetical protein